MLNYNDLYEILRKEKFSENLQQLPRNIVEDFMDFLSKLREEESTEAGLFSGFGKQKKQMDNAVSIFKELMLRRKKKLLNLVFVAAETGIMKRDYENMLDYERAVFDRIVRAFEEGEKELSKMLNGKKVQSALDSKRMIIFNQNVDEFVDMNGNLLGPYKSGELANIDDEVAKIFIDSGKARCLD